MKCHDVQRMIQGFIEKRLTDEQLEAFLEHIASCRDCYDELEVYYMITTGLLQLDEEHSGTLDFRKNLKDFIETQWHALCMRKRAEHNRKVMKRVAAATLMIVLVFTAHVFISSENKIESIDDFKDEAALSLYSFWFGEDAVAENIRDEEILPSDSKCRLNFERLHPVVLPADFDVEQLTLPGDDDIFRKGLIVE